MKLKRVTCASGLLVAVAIPLAAQLGESERRVFGTTRARAENGEASAQNELGVCYATGDGVTKDLTEAVKWFRQAAEQNFADGQNSLGYCYVSGQSTPLDLMAGYKWWRLAAAQGDGAGEEGRVQDSGRGVPSQFLELLHQRRQAHFLFEGRGSESHQ